MPCAKILYIWTKIKNVQNEDCSPAFVFHAGYRGGKT